MKGVKPVMACSMADLDSSGFEIGEINMITIPCENDDFESLRELIYAVMKSKK